MEKKGLEGALQRRASATATARHGSAENRTGIPSRRESNRDSLSPRIAGASPAAPVALRSFPREAQSFRRLNRGKRCLSGH
jgi:hypothetical protein